MKLVRMEFIASKCRIILRIGFGWCLAGPFIDAIPVIPGRLALCVRRFISMALRLTLVMVCLLVGGIVTYLALAAFAVAGLAQMVVQVGWTLLVLSVAASELLSLVWLLRLVCWVSLPRLFLFLVEKWSLVADLGDWFANILFD